MSQLYRGEAVRCRVEVCYGQPMAKLYFYYSAMNARLDAEGNRVWAGAQVDIGHHYTSLSRKEFQLDKISAVEYEAPDE